uniref:Tectonic-3 isoform x1 n=1 Tax=Tetraselmis sp. GSL018 TaxID=582737 RepID=A0A061SKF3_9CHLO
MFPGKSCCPCVSFWLLKTTLLVLFGLLAAQGPTAGTDVPESSSAMPTPQLDLQTTGSQAASSPEPNPEVSSPTAFEENLPTATGVASETPVIVSTPTIETENSFAVTAETLQASATPLSATPEASLVGNTPTPLTSGASQQSTPLSSASTPEDVANTPTDFPSQSTPAAPVPSTEEPLTDFTPPSQQPAPPPSIVVTPPLPTPAPDPADTPSPSAASDSEIDPYEEYYDEPPSPPPPLPSPPPATPGSSSPGQGSWPGWPPAPPQLPPPPPPQPPPPSPPPPPVDAPPSQLIRGDGRLTLTRPLYSYQVNWDDVPISPPDRMQQLDKPVTEIGSCMCDLTLNGCDGNCCCDPDCTEEMKDLFTACFPEGPPLPMLEYCLPKSLIAEVNLPSSSSFSFVTKKAADKRSFVDQLMCVVEDNNPVLGVYFADPPPGTAADLEGRASSWPTDPEPPSADVRSEYTVGSTIRAFLVSGESVAAAPQRVFTVPVARYTAMCDSAQEIYFGLRFPSSAAARNTCQRYFESLASACVDSAESPLSGRVFLDDLRLAQGRQGNSRVGVTLTGLKYRNLDGTLSELEPSLPLPAPSFANNTCNNTLVAVDYTIAMTQTGTISEVQASVTVAAEQGDIDGAAAIDQEFSVNFRQADQSAAGRPNSGSPGYLVGFPVLAGIEAQEPDAAEAESKVAVQQLIGGLPLPVGSPKDGTCGVEHSQPVRFGTDVVSSCTVPLTLNQLSSFCRGSPQDGAPLASPAIPLQLMGGLLTSSRPTRIGRWGNSDPNFIGEWVQVELESNATGMRWDSGSGTCSNVITGFYLEFVTNYVGAADNPQTQISFARVTFIRSSWTFSDLRSPNTSQAFEVENRVRFVAQKQQPAQAVRGNNPFVLPRFPADVFYPFTSASRPAPPPSSLAAALLAVLLALAQ